MGRQADALENAFLEGAAALSIYSGEAISLEDYKAAAGVMFSALGLDIRHLRPSAFSPHTEDSAGTFGNKRNIRIAS